MIKKEGLMKKLIAAILIILLLFPLFYFGGYPIGQTLSFEKHSAQVIAHRGLSGLEIENTESAFIAAAERSYYAIEADVKRTGDGKFIICHDANLKDLAGQDINVEEATLKELLEITLSSPFKNKTDKLCELETYISICKAYGKRAFLELKSAFTEAEIDAIIEIIDSYEYLENVTFLSDKYKSLRYIRQSQPEQSVQYVASELNEEIIKQLINDKMDVAVFFVALRKDTIDAFHAAGLKVNCWTIDNKYFAEHLASIGVDYITTNILE